MPPRPPSVTPEPNLIVQASSLRDIIRSRIATGDERQLPALEAALELEGA